MKYGYFDEQHKEYVIDRPDRHLGQTTSVHRNMEL